MYRDTGGVNLHVSRVGEVSALAVAGHGGADVAGHGVGAKEVGVAVAAGGYYHSVSGEAFHLAGDEVLGDDAAGAFHAVLILYQHHVVHLIAVEALHLAGLYLTVQARVGAEQKLLACLAFGVERTRYLSAAERTVGKQTAIFACEGNALCHALVDDVIAHLSQTVYVGLTGAIVAALHRVVEQTINAVAVVLIVLGCVNTALSGYGVCAARTVLDAEVEHVEAHLCQGGGCRCAGQTRTYYYDVEFALVGRVHQLLVRFEVGPFLSDRTLRNLGVSRIHHFDIFFNIFHIAN